MQDLQLFRSNHTPWHQQFHRPGQQCDRRSTTGLDQRSKGYSGNLQMIGLPNHLPPSTYLRVLQPPQKGQGPSNKRKKRSTPPSKGKHRTSSLCRDGLCADAAPTATSRSAAALKQKKDIHVKEITWVCLLSSSDHSVTVKAPREIPHPSQLLQL